QKACGKDNIACIQAFARQHVKYFSGNSKYRNNFILGSIIPYDKNGKELKGQNFWVTKHFTKGFDVFTGSVVIPEDASENAKLKLHFDWWHTGRIYFDEIKVSAAGTSAVIMPLGPSNLAVGKEEQLNFRVKIFGEKLPDTALYIEAGNQKRLVRPSTDGLYSTRMSFTQGVTPLKVYLLDLAGKRLIAKYHTDLFRHKREPGTPLTQIDRYGRTLVNGKPFLPIGTFTYQRMTEEDLKRLRDAGFNFISFGIRAWNLDKKNSNSAPEMKRMLDGLKEHGLMAVLQLNLMIPQKEHLRQKFEPEFDGVSGRDELVTAAVNAVKSHPAFLAYYLADENHNGELPDVQNLRCNIAAVDPNHFSIVLTDRRDNFPYFVSTGDILCHDSYPFGSAIPNEFEHTDKSLHALKEQQTPFWLCPQGFDWARLNKKIAELPTEEEIVALPLLGVVYGAKGFYFFSYHEIFTKGVKMDKDYPAQFWPRVAKASGILQELSCFILSTRAPLPLKINPQSGIVRASALVSEKNALAIIIVGVSQRSNNSAELELPAPPAGSVYKSQYGRTTQLPSGNWKFDSAAVGYDVVLSVPAK
ncbi:MAG: hypothetical protein JXR78_03250, partial [Victivallales bacterium]|nr:hypothetical protein [Victivallales bacterium]